MKKFGLLFLIILLAIPIILLGWLMYETWHVFGFWRLVGTSLLTLLALYIFVLRSNSTMKEKDNEVVFNPKELPVFLFILSEIGIATYLYFYLIGAEGLSTLDMTYGYLYIIVLSVIPILISLYKLIRDRNDFISISATHINYRDNATRESFELSSIQKVEIEGKGLKLSFKDGSDHIIPIGQMNFKLTDLFPLMKKINERISPDAHGE